MQQYFVHCFLEIFIIRVRLPQKIADQPKAFKETMDSAVMN